MNEKLVDINKVTYQKLGELLFEFIPEHLFFDNLELDKSEYFGNYTFMNEFSMKLCKAIEEDKSSEFVNSSYKFINCISESNNLEVLNILKVGILEILYTSGNSIRNNALERLNDKNKIFFLEFSQLYS